MLSNYLYNPIVDALKKKPIRQFCFIRNNMYVEEMYNLTIDSEQYLFKQFMSAGIKTKKSSFSHCVYVQNINAPFFIIVFDNKQQEVFLSYFRYNPENGCCETCHEPEQETINSLDVCIALFSQSYKNANLILKGLCC